MNTIFLLLFILAACFCAALAGVGPFAVAAMFFALAAICGAAQK